VSSPERDRDFEGRPRNARPRDVLGRPLAAGSPAAVSRDPELARLEAADPATLLAGAQRLLDGGRPFQAHEVLEAAWKRAPAGERALWRALAQLAVGLTHHLRGNPAGAKALFRRSAEALQAWEGSNGPHRIDASGLAGWARRAAEGETPGPLRLTR
jgi:uncharacterized protein